MPSTLFPLPRLRDGITLSRYSRGADGEQTFVAAAAGHAYLVSASVATVIDALRVTPESFDDLVRVVSSKDSRVTPDVLARFIESGIPAGLRADDPLPPRRDPFLLRKRLVSPAAAAIVARAGTWLFRPGVAAVVLPIVLGLLLTGVARSFDPALRVSPSSALGVVGLILFAMILHELGHISGSAAYGVAPGEVGIAVYFTFPVLYADVSRSWQLERAKRLAVTAGGFYFQACAMAVAVVWNIVSGSAVANWFVFVNALSIVHMLNPMFKMDGYWLLSDATAIPNLHRRVASTLRREPGVLHLHGWQYIVLAAYAILAIGYFTILGGQLARASLWFVQQRGAYAMELTAIMHRTLDAPTLLFAISRALQLAYALLRPLLLLAGWVFLARQTIRLFRSPRPATLPIGATPVAVRA